MGNSTQGRWHSALWRRAGLPVLVAVIALATSHAAAPAANATGDMGGFWQITYEYAGSPIQHCSVSFPPGSTGTFSGNTSCTDAAVGTATMTLLLPPLGNITSGTVNFTTPVYTVTVNGIFDDGANTWQGDWYCTSGCGASGTFTGTRIPATTGVTFPGTTTAADGTTITSSDSGAYTLTLEPLTTANPPPAGTTGALLTAYSFTPSHTFSPCTPGAPQGAPYFGSGVGGPLLEFHIPAAQVVLSALPFSVFVSDGSGWSNVGAGNVSDGSGGYYVAAVVCHFSLYTAFGPAPLAPDADADAVLDATDNCPAVANGPAQAGIPGVGNQTDTDADLLGDACDADDDNDGLLDAVETGTGVYVDANNTGTAPTNPDTDADGYNDGGEVALGKGPLTYCSIMRADVNMDGAVRLADLIIEAGWYNKLVPPAPARNDQNADGRVALADLIIMASVYNKPVTLCP